MTDMASWTLFFFLGSFTWILGVLRSDFFFFLGFFVVLSFFSGQVGAQREYGSSAGDAESLISDPNQEEFSWPSVILPYDFSPCFVLLSFLSFRWLACSWGTDGIVCNST